MRRIFSMLMIVAIGILFSSFAESQELTAAQQQGVVNNSLKWTLQKANISSWPQSVLSYKAGPWKIFKPVERVSANGIKFRTWPIKVIEGSGIVQSTVDIGISKSMQNWALSVSYTAYVYFNETEELKFEVSDVKILSNQKIE